MTTLFLIVKQTETKLQVNLKAFLLFDLLRHWSPILLVSSLLFTILQRYVQISCLLHKLITDNLPNLHEEFCLNIRYYLFPTGQEREVSSVHGVWPSNFGSFVLSKVKLSIKSSILRDWIKKARKRAALYCSASGDLSSAFIVLVGDVKNLPVQSFSDFGI